MFKRLSVVLASALCPVTTPTTSPISKLAFTGWLNSISTYFSFYFERTKNVSCISLDLIQGKGVQSV
jgi:hypothetical protein